MKATLVSVWISCLLLLTTRAAAVAVEQNSYPISPSNQATQAQPASSSTSESLAKKIDAITRAPSNGIAEIVKMVENGVEAPVIQSYVENSNVAYNPTANDILYLHEHGVPSSIITAMIRRGAEIRTQQAKAYQENLNRNAASTAATAPTAPAQAPATAPPVVVTTAPATSYYYTYPQPYPVYVPYSYPIYSYSYALPTYSLFSYYAYRPYYYHYPATYYSSCFPRYHSGFSIGFRSHSPHVSVGASFGHFGHGGHRGR